MVTSCPEPQHELSNSADEGSGDDDVRLPWLQVVLGQQHELSERVDEGSGDGDVSAVDRVDDGSGESSIRLPWL